MSVLVNGSPTREFGVSRGLGQGDPLSPFLYVIVAEGLTGLVRKSIEVGDFFRGTINGSCWVDILQFADYTLIVGEGSWKDVWAIKVVLRAFEFVSGLGINYHKSKLIGINTSNNFLEAASFFLSCKVEESNFYFLGIPTGFNPMKESTWNPLLSKMKNRLEGWTNWFLNLGDRITLLKSILSSLAIFTMSFYKMPAKVVKKFTRIQSKFLWGGLEERRKIHWVSRKDVNLPFEKVGLEVKNIAMFNLALLNKLDDRFCKEEYPDLFLVSSLKRVLVAVMGAWKEVMWQWGDFGINPAFLETLKFLVHYNSFLERLEGFNRHEEGKDKVE
ncbi:uncharacterized protein LOC131597740 [Vicia villosa]|uniref:uncharacterized protein LOC131597740 n=1 Tax=Vicia villosa TaxID=3911 RepID=UPI00273BC3A3|nr:uncharacterized protein LOC131597740 [Vicia villosa]